CWSRRGLVLSLLAAGAGAVLFAVPAAAAAPRTTQLLVYATREGLVGGITANGHVIVPHDHFVSLPSWGSLSPKGTGTYSVRVCGGLRLPADNRWVTVSMLWTGTGTQGQIRTDGDPLNVRSGPGTGYASVGLAGPLARVPILCQVPGEPIAGLVASTRLWDRIG